MDKYIKDRLERSSVFCDISALGLMTLAPFCRLEFYRRDETVLLHSRQEKDLFLVQSGTLRVFLVGTHGTQTVLNLVGPSEILGEVNWLDGRGHSADVVACERSELLHINAMGLLKLQEQCFPLQTRLQDLVAQRFRALSDRQMWIGSVPVGERVGRLLLHFVARFNPGGDEPILIPLRLCQNDLAALAGISRFRVNVCLRELEEKSLVRCETRSRLFLPCPRALAHWCDEQRVEKHEKHL